jgi:long-subunit acyl-CoA synthetase (AMP-forming)
MPDSGLDTERMWRLMGFYSENRSEYITTELACIAESITLVPISSRPNDLYNASHILKETQLDTIFVSGGKLGNLLKIISESGNKSVKTLITVDEDLIAQVDLDGMKELGITHYSYT